MCRLSVWVFFARSVSPPNSGLLIDEESLPPTTDVRTRVPIGMPLGRDPGPSNVDGTSLHTAQQSLYGELFGDGAAEGDDVEYVVPFYRHY